MELKDLKNSVRHLSESILIKCINCVNPIFIHHGEDSNPRSSVLQYFVTFLRDHRTSPDPTRQYVEWCADNCNHMQAAIRKNPPSTVEITVRTKSNIFFQS
jgi:hypothetical protein